MWDHPFQWGSKRIGPDLARVGGKYPSLWHFRHMYDPRVVTPNSIMPEYTWLFSDKTDFAILRKKFEVMKTLGVPYSDSAVASAELDAKAEAKIIADELAAAGGVPAGIEDKQIVALIAYLQRLGRNPGVKP